MLAKTLFKHAEKYTWDHFKRDFRVITDKNINLVAKMYGWRDSKHLYRELQVDITGLFVALAAEETYGNQNVPAVIQNMINACKELQATEENISDFSLYENVSIFWFMGDTSGGYARVYPHSILEFMEPNGEGDIQFDEDDYENIK